LFGDRFSARPCVYSLASILFAIASSFYGSWTKSMGTLSLVMQYFSGNSMLCLFDIIIFYQQLLQTHFICYMILWVCLSLSIRPSCRRSLPTFAIPMGSVLSLASIRRQFFFFLTFPSTIPPPELNIGTTATKFC
jgi:hypothetical protein